MDEQFEAVGPTTGQKVAGIICGIFGIPIRFGGLLVVFVGVQAWLSAAFWVGVLVYVGLGGAGLLVGRTLYLYGLVLGGKVNAEGLESLAKWGVWYVVRGVVGAVGIASGLALALHLFGSFEGQSLLLRSSVVLGVIVASYCVARVARLRMRGCRRDENAPTVDSEGRDYSSDF